MPRWTGLISLRADALDELEHVDDLHRVVPRIGASASAAGQKLSTSTFTGGCDREHQRQRERGAQRPPRPPTPRPHPPRYLVPHRLPLWAEDPSPIHAQARPAAAAHPLSPMQYM
jgi:hypothetical protein